jgi:preprotein translocase subunit SecD
LPSFGGNMPNGIFAAAFADGSVRILTESIDPAMLRAMLTIAGGEPMSNLDAPAKPEPGKSSSLRIERGAGNVVAISWNNEKVDQAELVRRLQAAAASKQSVSITADKDVAMNDLNSLLGAAKEAGVQKIVLDPAQVRIEFRRGETEPAAGLTEVATPDGPRKVFVVAESGISNDDIAEATVVKDNLGQPAISIVFTPAGSEKMRKLTEQQMGKPLVIMANGKVLSAPTVRATISEKAQISGNFSQEEAARIANGIRRK